MDQKSKCRVCESELKSGTSVCQTCGRMVVHYPEQLPEKFRESLDEEKKIYNQQNASKGDIQRNLKEKVNKIKKQGGDIERLKKMIKEKDEQIRSSGKELQDWKDKYNNRICSKCGKPYIDDEVIRCTCGNVRPTLKTQN